MAQVFWHWGTMTGEHRFFGGLVCLANHQIQLPVGVKLKRKKQGARHG